MSDNSNYVLGFGAYAHDAAAALLKDGTVIAVCEEERLDRRKHSAAFPEKSIRFCLEQAGIPLSRVNHAAFFWRPAAEIYGNIFHFARYFPRSLGLLRGGGEGLGFLPRVRAMTGVERELCRVFGGSGPRVHFVEHHLAHAASAFFLSGFKEAAILTLDGRGENASTLLARGRDGAIEKLSEVPVPHSLGHLFAAITWHLGFRPFADEWKVMGMAAYGTSALETQFREVLIETPGGYRLNLDYFSFHTEGQGRWLSATFFEKFGPRRDPGAALEQRHFDLARALQKSVENAAVNLAGYLRERTGAESLCVAGGVAFNCLMNSQIARRSGFRHFYFQPLAGDAGAALGAAVFHQRQTLGGAAGEPFKSLYLGPSFSDDEILAELRLSGLSFRRPENLARETAEGIARGKITGWFQGRMECGPRALGNRSILADPRDPEMKQRLNARVKMREGFRPFAPAVLKERAGDYFSLPAGLDSPHMILAGEVRSERRSEIPAVTHADFTARVQTVDQTINPQFWSVISEFDRITGVPLVLNTSFNENEPIVCRPQEALACFRRTHLDQLAIGSFLVKR